jgi:phosphatidylserine/phosphatidylglycerophosphate/cardiolipin synthase-like enzyme
LIHIKMMLIDDAVTMIMNQNLTQSAFTTNREFGVETNQPDAVQAAAAIFAADWTRGAEPDPGPLVVSPTNAREQLLALVRGARVSLDLYAEVLRDPQVLDALAARKQKGPEPKPGAAIVGSETTKMKLKVGGRSIA